MLFLSLQTHCICTMSMPVHNTIINKIITNDSHRPESSLYIFLSNYSNTYNIYFCLNAISIYVIVLKSVVNVLNYIHAWYEWTLVVLYIYDILSSISYCKLSWFRKYLFFSGTVHEQVCMWMQKGYIRTVGGRHFVPWSNKIYWLENDMI